VFTLADKGGAGGGSPISAQSDQPSTGSSDAASLTRFAALTPAVYAAWDQLGCLSPHVFYVQQGGAVNAEQFAERLADELAAREQSEPRGTPPAATAATIASRRAFYEVRAVRLIHLAAVSVSSDAFVRPTCARGSPGA
jgi:hypothetical protein